MRVVAVLLVLMGALSACSSPDSPATGPAPTAAGTPLGSYVTTGFAVPRADFCGLIAEETAARALEGSVVGTDAHVNGDRVEVAKGVTDVVHEFSCSWRGGDGTTVSAWVFAPPITASEARDLRRSVTRDRSCEAVSGPEFGASSVPTVCHRGKGRTQVAFHGLFGDAWLSCAITGPGKPKALRARAAGWCVDVLAATRVSP
jgi:hypothetical protein